MKISSGQIRKGSNSKYLVCLDTSKNGNFKYLALNLKTGSTTPVNSTFIKSTKLETVQVLVGGNIKILPVLEVPYYAVVNHGIVERISIEKFDLRSASELASPTAKLCVLSKSVKPFTPVDNKLLEVIDG